MNARRRRAWAVMDALDPGLAARLEAALADIAPGFASDLAAFAFGDVCARPGLDLGTRELVTIGALAALGNAAPQLRTHILAALNVGCTRTQVAEVLVQMAVYAGVPAALNGLAVARQVFVDHGS